MLTPKYLQRIIEATEKKTSQLNSYLTSKIVDRILTLFENTGEINVNPSSIHDAMKQEAAGKLFDEVQEEIIRHLPIIQDEVRVAFMDAAGKINKDVYEFTKNVIDVEHEKGELLDVNIPELPEATDFEKVGIPQSAADLNLTPKEIRMLESAYNRTNGEIYNITQTTATATEQTFIEACDSAYWKVAHGVSPSTAITEAIEEVSAKGITTVHYGRRDDKIEVAIARAVRTGINQANGDIKLTRCAELGAGHVRVNSHIGARVTKYEDYTNHSLWQGKVYKLDWRNPTLSKYQPTQQEIKENKKSFAFMDKIKQFFTRKKSEEEYEDFIVVCGYGKMLGICGINCRHSFDPFYPGVNINTDKPIDPEKNRQRYELEQKQRAKEREIRELKRKKYAFDNAEPSDKQTKEAIEEKRKELKEKLTQKRAEYRDFCKENRLSTENYRLQIAKANGVNNISEIAAKSIKMPEGLEKVHGMTENIEKEIKQSLDNIQEEYNVNLNVALEDFGIEESDTPFKCVYEDINGTVNRCIKINEGFDFHGIQDTIIAGYDMGYFAGKSISDYIYHEAAHYMTGLNITDTSRFNRFMDTIQKCYVPGVSGYADSTQDGAEVLAEAFVRIRNGEPVPKESEKLVIQFIERWRK